MRRRRRRTSGISNFFHRVLGFSSEQSGLWWKARAARTANETNGESRKSWCEECYMETVCRWLRGRLGRTESRRARLRRLDESAVANRRRKTFVNFTRVSISMHRPVIGGGLTRDFDFRNRGPSPLKCESSISQPSPSHRLRAPNWIRFFEGASLCRLSDFCLGSG